MGKGREKGGKGAGKGRGGIFDLLFSVSVSPICKMYGISDWVKQYYIHTYPSRISVTRMSANLACVHHDAAVKVLLETKLVCKRYGS